MKIRAVVVSNPGHGTVTLQWRELLGERQQRVTYKPGLKECYVVPVYGAVLASVVRPHREFIAALDEGGLASYVRRHLPEP